MKRETRYQIRLFDQALAEFDWAENEYGEQRAEHLEIDESAKRLLPLNMRCKPCDAELRTFLLSRRLPLGAPNAKKILEAYGLAPNDTKGIIEKTRGMSVNDSYCIVPASDKVSFEDYNVFNTAHDETLQLIALTGAVPARITYQGFPATLSNVGSFPKAWRRIDGQLQLFKAGSRRGESAGMEPYAEVLAYDVLQTACLNAVEYKLETWNDVTCTSCALFNTKDVSYTPYALSLDAETLDNATLGNALEPFENLPDHVYEDFRKMAVADAIICNVDRHMGNFGFLRDNRTGDIVGLAPLHDHNLSMFIKMADRELTHENMADKAAKAIGLFTANLKRQAEQLADKADVGWLEKLTEFTFGDAVEEAVAFAAEEKNEHVTMSRARIGLCAGYVRETASELLRIIESDTGGGRQRVPEKTRAPKQAHLLDDVQALASTQARSQSGRSSQQILGNREDLSRQSNHSL